MPACNAHLSDELDGLGLTLRLDNLLHLFLPRLLHSQCGALGVLLGDLYHT